MSLQSIDYSIMSFSIIVNGYVVEVLSTLIRQEEAWDGIHGNNIFKNTLVISHLLFVDYCFLFLSTNDKEVKVMKNAIENYEAAFGKTIKFQ